MEMSIEQICFEVAKLDGDKQTQFIESLKDTLSENEIHAIQIGIAYFRMTIDDKLKNAMKIVIAKELFTQFTEKEV